MDKIWPSLRWCGGVTRRRPEGRHPFRAWIGARVASLRCPVFLSSLSSVRQLLKPEKQKPSILEKNSAKSRGGWGAAPPIMAMAFSLLTGVGTDLPACGSRAPGGGVGDCRSGSSNPALGSGFCYVRRVSPLLRARGFGSGNCIGFGARLRYDDRVECPSRKPTDRDSRRER